MLRWRLPESVDDALAGLELTRALATVDQAKAVYNQAQARMEAIRRQSSSSEAPEPTLPIATSPVGGLEPVQAICAILGTTVSHQALLPGEVRPLGPRWPRRWVSSQTD